MLVSISYFKNSSPAQISFKTIFIGVGLAHFLLFLLLFFNPLPKASRQKITLLQLLPQGDLAKGSPNLVSAPRPIPQPPVSQSIPQSFSALTQPKKKSAPSQPVKNSSPVKINLNVTKRSISSPHLKPVTRPIAASSRSAVSSVSAGDIKNRLESRVGKAGVTSATADGQSGILNGVSSSEASIYFALIRDVYYQAWQQPVPDLTKKWAAILKIRVNKQGNILKANLEQNSGYFPLDQSVKQVAHLVKTINSPLPDVLGAQFADISIVFEF